MRELDRVYALLNVLDTAFSFCWLLLAMCYLPRFFGVVSALCGCSFAPSSSLLLRGLRALRGLAFRSKLSRNGHAPVAPATKGAAP